MDETDFNIDESVGAGRRSPSESGSAEYTTGEAVPTSFDFADAADYLTARVMCRLEQAKPEPIALHVRLSEQSSPFDFQAMANFPLLAGGPGLALIVDYGDLAGRHRVVADLRSGTYQLPAVTFAQISMLQWNSLVPTAAGVLCSATLSRAPVANPKMFTFTGGGEIAAAGSAVVRVPFYAQFVDVWANGWAGGIGAANAPILRAETLGLYRDYTTGLFVPPWGPASYCGDAISTDSVTIENAGIAAVRVFAQFYLQP